MPSTGNLKVAGLCIAFGGVMSSIPYFMRQNTPNFGDKDRLTGSQRQRGLYLQAGSQDAGRDPDWDPIERRWTGYDKKYLKQQMKNAEKSNTMSNNEDDKS